MRPLTVLTGFVLGSCLSIAVSLAAVLVMFLFLGDDYPRLQHEFRGLVASFFIFFAMTAISAASFYLMTIKHRYRHAAQAAMWLGVLAVGYYYWP